MGRRFRRMRRLKHQLVEITRRLLTVCFCCGTIREKFVRDKVPLAYIISGSVGQDGSSELARKGLGPCCQPGTVSPERRLSECEEQSSTSDSDIQPDKLSTFSIERENCESEEIENLESSEPMDDFEEWQGIPRSFSFFYTSDSSSSSSLEESPCTRRPDVRENVEEARGRVEASGGTNLLPVQTTSRQTDINVSSALMKDTQLGPVNRMRNSNLEHKALMDQRIVRGPRIGQNSVQTPTRSGLAFSKYFSRNLR